MKRLSGIVRNLALCFCIAAMTASCDTYRPNLNYFEDIIGSDNGTIQLDTTTAPVVIQPGDELRISITSNVASATAGYNLPLVNPGNASTSSVQSIPMIETYIVSADGDVDIPTLGAVKLAGITTDQAQEKIEKLVAKDVKSPYVVVRLVNFKVRVLGEVRSPHTISKPASKKDYTVLDAITEAGDLTPYSDRTNVMVMRREGDKMVYHRLNLNESSALTSPYFFLQQDDIVIVPPNKIRQDNASYNSNNAFKIQVVSTIVSVVSVIASLVIALTVK